MTAANDINSGLTGSVLEKILRYDPITGFFYHNKTRGGALAGTKTGSLRKDGYVQIKIHGKYILAHRLAWVWMFGSWPSKDIDHKNRNREDNRIDNLRLATKHQNGANSSLNILNRSGYSGVFYQKPRGNRRAFWRAFITVNRRRVNLGSFQTKEEAATARQKAECLYYGEYARKQ